MFQDATVLRPSRQLPLRNISRQKNDISNRCSDKALQQRENQSPVAFKDISFTNTIRSGRLYHQEDLFHIFL